MYLVVFMTRYMDLFLYFISIYNTVFKILFIAATSYIIYLIRFKRPYCLGYDSQTDSLNHYLYIYPVALLLTVVFHLSLRQQHYYYEYLWSFSVWLEAFTIVPQLYIVYKKREVG
jgi:ER lumen protein retaining receptor